MHIGFTFPLYIGSKVSVYVMFVTVYLRRNLGYPAQSVIGVVHRLPVWVRYALGRALIGMGHGGQGFAPRVCLRNSIAATVS